MPSHEITPRSVSVAFSALIGNLVCSAPVVTATFGVFLIPVTQEFGWSRASFSFVLTIVSVIGVFMLPFAGRIADRFGVRRVLLIGNLLFGAAMALVALCGPRVVDFYVAYVLVALASAFSSTVLLSRVVVAWFSRNRGLLLGVTAGIGNGLGCAIMPIFALSIMQHAGWRGAYLSLGALVAALGFPVLFWAFREPATAQTGGATVMILNGLEAREARRTGLFWLILVAVAVGGGALSAIFTHVIPILSDSGMIGSAELVISGVAISSVISQITLGRVLDSTTTPRIAAALILSSVAGIWVMAEAGSTKGFVIGGILVGIGNGAEYALLSYIVPRYFGFRSFSEIYGSILGVVFLAMGMTPMLMDMSFDAFGSYRPSLGVIGLALIGTCMMIVNFPAYRYSREGHDEHQHASHEAVVSA